MYGGPVGFDGAERYQYPLDSEEGRAIDGLRKLSQDGKAPDTLIVQVLELRPAAVREGLPEGAPTPPSQLFEEETGHQDRVRRDRPGRPSTRRTCATRRPRTAASTSSRARSRRSATSPRPGCSCRSTTTSRSTSRAGPTPSSATSAASRRWPCSTSTRARRTRSRSTTTRSRTSTARDLLDERRRAGGVRGQVRPPADASRETWEQQAEVAEFFTRPDASTRSTATSRRSRRSGAPSTGTSGSSAPPTRT